MCETRESVVSVEYGCVTVYVVDIEFKKTRNRWAGHLGLSIQRACKTQMKYYKPQLGILKNKIMKHNGIALMAILNFQCKSYYQNLTCI